MDSTSVNECYFGLANCTAISPAFGFSYLNSALIPANPRDFISIFVKSKLNRTMPRIATPIKISIVLLIMVMDPDKCIDNAKTNKIIKMRNKNILSSEYNKSPTRVRFLCASMWVFFSRVAFPNFFGALKILKGAIALPFPYSAYAHPRLL